MVIVIDGYNVLKQLHDEMITAQERNRYINRLKQYAKKKGHTIILVFDGGYSEWQNREKHGNVIVIYSGTRQTADDAIMNYLEENQDKDLLLVSADRQLVDHASGLGIVAIAPFVFDGYVKQALGKLPTGVEFAQTDAQKLHKEQENEELDTLMREASLMIEHKPEEHVQNKTMRKGKDFKVSKKERKITAKLKKL